MQNLENNPDPTSPVHRMRRPAYSPAAANGDAPQVNDVNDDDPALAPILMGFGGRTVFPISHIIGQPLGRTATYEEVNKGTLRTFLARGRRYALAVEYAKYLLRLSRAEADKKEAA